jgi:cytochrome P450
MQKAFHSTDPATGPGHDWQYVRAGVFRGATDIHAIHDDMRNRAPVWHAPWGDVYVTTYDLVSACLVNSKLSHVPPVGSDPARSALHDWLMYQEGSTHAAIRQALRRPFAGKGMAALQPIIAEAIATLVSTSDFGAVVNVVSAFTRAVPERVICRLLGVPEEDMPLIRAWSASIRGLLDAGFDDAFGARANAADEMSDYFIAHLRGLLTGKDLPLLLTDLPEMVDRLGLAVTGRNIAFLAFAGHETTVHLLGNMLFHLAHTPDQWSALRADRKLVVQAVAETLRLESPVQKICRWPQEAIDLDGQMIDKGQIVVLLVGAANRDPAQFAHPSRFNLDRPGRQNLAFGRGAHVCIGRALAEMEGAMVLDAVLARWKTIEPINAAWMDNSSIRGLDTLSLRLSG